MRTYFATGLSGFIGRAILRQLIAKDDTERVICLTRRIRPELIQHPKVTYIEGDVIDFDYPSIECTDLIHAAAEANDLLQPDQPKYYMTVVEGARRIFEWASKSHFQRVLFVSSGGVFKGDSPYCRAKRMSEWIARKFEIKERIVRLYSVVGEEMPLNGQYALGRFIWQAHNEGEVKFFSGASVRSYIHVDECAELILGIMDSPAYMNPVPIGSSVPISIENLAHLTAQIFNVPCRQIEATTDLRQPNVYLPPCDYKPKIDLHTSIRRVRDYLRR